MATAESAHPIGPSFVGSGWHCRSMAIVCHPAQENTRVGWAYPTSCFAGQKSTSSLPTAATGAKLELVAAAIVLGERFGYACGGRELRGGVAPCWC